MFAYYTNYNGNYPVQKLVFRMGVLWALDITFCELFRVCN